MMTKSISDIVLETRRQMKMTQEEFGAALGVTKQAVSAWEKGERKPGAITLMSILLQYKDWRFDFAVRILTALGLLTE